MREPIEPDYSCPKLYAAIEEIEAARRIHIKLREWGQWWQDHAEDLQKEKEELEREKDEEIAGLEKQIAELKEELRYATRENSFA